MRYSVRILSTIALCIFMTGCLKQELQTGLTEQESQEIIVLLKQHGLDGARQLVVKGKETPTWTVYVRGGNQNLVAAWRLLQENGMPRSKSKGLDEVFGAQGLIPTASEEKAKLLVGLSGEIARTLKSVSGIVDARVHVVLPENSPLLDKSQWSPTTASVLVKYRGDQPPLKETEIRSLVSKGVEGLAPEQVAVVFNKVPQVPDSARGIEWYLGNQELTFGAVGLMGLAAILALIQTFQVQRLKRQLAAIRQSYANQVPATAAKAR